jgi:hypothetical protein
LTLCKQVIHTGIGHSLSGNHRRKKSAISQCVSQRPIFYHNGPLIGQYRGLPQTDRHPGSAYSLCHVHIPAGPRQTRLVCGPGKKGRSSLREIALDGEGTIDVDALQRMLDDDTRAGRSQVAIVACAGDVNTGRIDLIDRIARIAGERGIWLHVDGAYGGWGLLDARVRERFGDVACYDSFAIDPHKWLAAPVGTGAAIVRDAGVLGRAFECETGAYDRERHAPIGTADTGSPFDELGLGTPDFGVDFSAPARGLAVWAILREIGANGVRERIVRHNDCARRVADRVRNEPMLELLAEPVLSICCFRVRPPHWNDESRLDAFNDAVLHAMRARPQRDLVDAGRWPLLHSALFHQPAQHTGRSRYAGR